MCGWSTLMICNMPNDKINNFIRSVSFSEPRFELCVCAFKDFVVFRWNRLYHWQSVFLVYGICIVRWCSLDRYLVVSTETLSISEQQTPDFIHFSMFHFPVSNRTFSIYFMNETYFFPSLVAVVVADIL